MAGKKGQKRTSGLLRQMLWVARNPTAEPADEFTRKLQEQFRDDFDTFSSRLERLETAWHKSGRSTAPEAANPQVDGSTGAVDLDRGWARLEEMMRAKGLDKCSKCGEILP